MAVIKLFIFFSLLWRCSLSICRSVQGTTCCSGTFWNDQTSTCEDCPLGYHDFNCSEICIFPSYGEDCQNTCECNSSGCDYRYGCRESIGITGYNAANLQNTTTVQVFGTRSTLTGSTSSGENITGMPNFLFYLITTSVAIFLILCTLCVGTYFYKHCIKQEVVTVTPKDRYSSDAKDLEGYSKGENTRQQRNPSSNLVYLEPVNSYKTVYDDIENSELNEPFQL